MSEAIKIKEGGVDRSQNQINKLKTNTVGGGVCFWVPETERQTDDKRITENGTYTAEEEGLYGYDEITVSIPNTGSMSGRGADGNDYSITVDDDGYIVETKIPSAIRIENLPVRLQYNEGDTIDYTGIFVGAYDAHGNRLYDVPFNELVFTETTAHASGSGGKTATSDLDTVPETPIKCGDRIETESKRRYGIGDVTSKEIYTGGTCVVVQGTDSPKNLRIIIASATPGQFTYTRETTLDETGEIISQNSETIEFNTVYTHNGKTVYYNYIESIGVGETNVITPFPERLNTETLITHGEVAWTIIYGITTGGTQTLPVQWARPGDGKQLDDYFEISVQPVESGIAHSNEGGSEHGF